MFDAIGRFVYDLMMGFSSVLGGNPILTVVVFTVILRVIMSPFDIISRKAMAKQSAAQPYIMQIQKRYAGSPQMMQKKMSEFNKKHGISMFKGCLPMLLTLPLFIIFLNAMNYWGYISNINIFLEAQAGNYDISAHTWLWVRNIWSPDSGLAPVVLSAEQFAQIPFDSLTHYFDAATLESVKLAAANGGAIYSTTMQPILAQFEGYANGWFILPLISAGFVMLQGLLSRPKNPQPTPTGQPAPGGGIGMSIFIALFSGYICLSYNAMFAFYWITSNVCAILLQLILKKVYPAESFVFEGEAEIK